MRHVIELNPYTFHINPYDLTFFGVIFIGLTFAFLLGFTKKTNQSANRFLALALSVMILWVVRILAADIRLPLQFSLALGPLIYFYVLKLTRPAYKFSRKDLLHFVPLLPEQFVLTNPVLPFLTLISVITYLYLSHRLIERYYRRQKFSGGDRYRAELRWLHQLLASFGLLWLLWIPYTAVGYFVLHRQLSIQADYPFYLAMTAMLIWVAAAAYLRPDISSPINQPVFLKPTLPAELKQKGAWLKNVVKTNLYYQDPELSLSSLAERLGLTTHELSRIINTALKKNFNDFINEYRVAEVIRRMQDPAYDHITLLGTAYDSGFNSKSTFNLIFKKITGKAPAEYKTELKKEFLSYNLGRHPQFAAIISNHETTLKWSQEKLNRNFMFINYLKVAWRNITGNKIYSALNIVGLAVGMAAFLLIVMYVRFETSYDKFHSNTDQIYRLDVDIKSANDLLKFSTSSAPMGPAIKEDFPEVLQSTRIFPSSALFKVKNQLFQEDRVFIAEPSIFTVFSFPLTKGDAKTSLKNPFSVVLTETTAKKYFGSENPMGKTLLVDGKYPVAVTGVVKDVPANSQFKFDILYSVSTLEKLYPGFLQQWGNLSNITYLLLSRGTNPNQLQSKFPAFLRRHISESDRKNGNDYNLYLKPLKDAYMDPRGSLEKGSMSNIYVFSFIALFILIIAAINFINLTTARATQRAKEVGVRKVIGAARSQLIIQFLSESVILCLVSFVFASLLVSLIIPMFNQLAGKTVSNGILGNSYLFILFLISLLIGLLAGAYPALALSGFKPVAILKGRFSSSSKGALLRKGLVVFQFTISIVLIVGTLVIYRQLNYMRNQPLGFEKNQLVTLDFGNDSDVIKSYESIKNEFRSIPNVLAVTISHGLPGVGSANAHSEMENRQGAMQPLNINMYDVDYDFIPEYGMKVIAGRTFSKDYGTDTTKAIVINEATSKILGYTSPKYAIGKKFSQWGREGQIIGVVKDFHYQSLQENVEPLNMRVNPSNARIFTLKIAASDIPATIVAIQAKWKLLIPQRPFNYTFVDENFNKQYAGEERFGKLFMYFATLAIFISCLGLLGLASYSTLQRTREIGIRKVLGASIPGIVNMLSKEFLILVVIAAFIAFPLSWYGMNTWLKDFAYKENISWMVFAAAGLLAFMIAITTVSFQAIRAALANPVKSLRSE